MTGISDKIFGVDPKTIAKQDKLKTPVDMDKRYNEYIEDENSESESEEEDVCKCEHCGKVCDSFDHYIEHTSITNCAFFCD